MALTIDTEILGQEATDTATYCYLYEPLRVSILEDDNTATKLFIDLEVLDTSNSTVIVENLSEYGNYDLNPGQRLSIDLMKLARQHHNANVYNFATIDQIVSDGWKSVVSEFKYNFKIYTDKTTVPISVVKLPIIGGRIFRNFVATVDQNTPINEAQRENFSLANLWQGYPVLQTALTNPSLQDARPIITRNNQPEGKEPCGGFIIWKSRLGGWMVWGFDIKTEKYKHKYQGNLDVNMFESTNENGGGLPYVPVDYTSIETGYSLSLKEIGLTQAALRVAASIQGTPAVYFMKNIEGDLELMRMSSASAPITSLGSGGDFSVSISNISKTMQKTR